MFDLNSKLETKAGSASTSSHAMYGWVTWHLQSVELPALKKLAACSIKRIQMQFPLIRYRIPCLKEQYTSNPTEILNFSSYLSVLPELCLSLIQGIRAVFTDIHYVLKEVIVIAGGGVRFRGLPVLKYGASATPAPQRTQ